MNPTPAIDPISWTAAQMQVQFMFRAASRLEARGFRGLANNLRSRARCMAAFYGFADVEGE